MRVCILTDWIHKCRRIRLNLTTFESRRSEQLLLLLRMEPVGDLLGDQGGVAAGAVVDDEIDSDIKRAWDIVSETSP